MNTQDVIQAVAVQSTVVLTALLTVPPVGLTLLALPLNALYHAIKSTYEGQQTHFITHCLPVQIGLYCIVLLTLSTWYVTASATSRTWLSFAVSMVVWFILIGGAYHYSKLRILRYR